MPKACEHGLKLSECFTCASPKTGAAPIPPASERELLPCPFCLTSNVRVHPRTCDKKTPYDARDRAFPVARCACGASMDGKDWGDEQTAIDAWNRRAALSHPSTPQGWQPIESAPKDGEFLVYMPNERAKIQAARWHPNVKTIGGTFHFDLTAPTHWMPLPPPPEQGGKG